MKVLISNPCLHPNSIYPPYLWARFKTFIDLDYDKKVWVDWLDPLYEHFPVLPDQSFDILIISCYVWNYEKQIELAKEARRRNPNVFIIAGGPQIPFSEDTVFEEYDCIDAFSYCEGEKVMADFLYAWQEGNSLDIPGFVLKTNPKKVQVKVPRLTLNNLHSAYLHCKDEIGRYCQAIKDKGYRLNIIWETNRGCPYNCSFCDWGMATNDKVYRFKKQNLLEEVKVMMSWKPDVFFIQDANWGMFDDDLDFVHALVDAKKEIGYSTAVALSPAKNKKSIVNKTFKLLHEAGMNGGANQIGFQHLDDDVLKVIERDNMKNIKSIEELTETFDSGVDLIGVLICGNPGDTTDKWKHSLFQLLYMCFHDDIKVHDFMLLPNAPAGKPAYMQKYKIGTVNKYYNEKPPGVKKNRSLYKAKFIVESFSFNRDDWVEMQIWSYFLQACHTLGLLRYVSLFAWHGLNIKYEDFYEAVFNIPVVQEILETSRVVLRDYVHGDKEDKFINAGDFITSIDNYIYLRMIQHLDIIYDSVEREFDFGDYSKDLFDFQRNICYNYYDKKNFESEYDLKQWFRKVSKLTPFKKLNSLPEKTRVKVEFDNFKKLTEYDIAKKLDKAPNYRHRIVLHKELL